MVKKLETCDTCGIPMETKQDDEEFFFAVCGSCGRHHLEVTHEAVAHHGGKYEVAANKPFEDGSWVRVSTDR